MAVRTKAKVTDFATASGWLIVSLEDRVEVEYRPGPNVPPWVINAVQLLVEAHKQTARKHGVERITLAVDGRTAPPPPRPENKARFDDLLTAALTSPGVGSDVRAVVIEGVEYRCGVTWQKPQERTPPKATRRVTLAELAAEAKRRADEFEARPAVGPIVADFNRFMVGFARRVERALSSYLENAPKDTFHEKQVLCRAVSITLAKYQLTIRCPVTGHSSLICARPGSKPAEGCFQLYHRSVVTGQRVATLTSVHLATLGDGVKAENRTSPPPVLLQLMPDDLSRSPRAQGESWSALVERSQPTGKLKKR